MPKTARKIMDKFRTNVSYVEDPDNIEAINVCVDQALTALQALLLEKLPRKWEAHEIPDRLIVDDTAKSFMDGQNQMIDQISEMIRKEIA